MANEIHWVAVQLGQASAGGRLDPPLLMALDEVTQICPVPLPVWLADSGGKGVQVIAVAHGDAQLASRWKDDGRRIIQDTSGVKILLPGITDIQTLETASKLCGDAAYREHGQEHLTRHPAMTPDMIRSLAGRPRAGDPRQHVAGRRDAADGLEGPHVPAGAAARPRDRGSARRPRRCRGHAAGGPGQGAPKATGNGHPGRRRARPVGAAVTAAEAGSPRGPASHLLGRGGQVPRHGRRT